MIRLIEGVVLRSDDSGEYDRRLTLFSKEFGKVAAKIAGVKKPASKLRALSIPFTQSRLQIFFHGTHRAGFREPGRVISGEILQFHIPLRNEWQRMMHAYTVCEILEMMTQPFYPSDREYDLLTRTLLHLETTPSPSLVRLRFSLNLLRMLGYGLKHHPIWKSYSDQQKGLLQAFARWNTDEDKFTEDESKSLEQMTSEYVMYYLAYPLKTEIFRQKLDAAELLNIGLHSQEYLSIASSP